MTQKLYQRKSDKREFSEQGGDARAWRSDYSRDYGRVIHSASFRRLQGKTQVFPGHESDFFRNRLTHSLEVAQIAVGIAERLNHVSDYFKKNPIDTQLCAAAGLMHDLGHPPFGHNGERALDDAMRNHGGFEGNAQTLRIVARLEKKIVDKNGTSFGLNLTFRSLASILKYDKEIPRSRRADSKVAKGYYGDEAKLVSRIKKAIVGKNWKQIKEFKTIECQIMDLADDIAYSTFDLEDSFKAEFLTPAGILASPDDLLGKVAEKVSAGLKRPIADIDVLEVFGKIFDIGVQPFEEQDATKDPLSLFAMRHRAYLKLTRSGTLRTQLSSELIKRAIDSVTAEVNLEEPALSTVSLSEDVQTRVEILKQYIFLATIYSNRVSIPEFRGYEVVRRIFEALAGKNGHLLMPDDVHVAFEDAKGNLDRQMRIICDFVAGMTDRYALEFYGRLHSDTAQSMFKPI